MHWVALCVTSAQLFAWFFLSSPPPGMEDWMVYWFVVAVVGVVGLVLTVPTLVALIVAVRGRHAWGWGLVVYGAAWSLWHAYGFGAVLRWWAPGDANLMFIASSTTASAVYQALTCLGFAVVAVGNSVDARLRNRSDGRGPDTPGASVCPQETNLPPR
ncbi:hypothetical protein Acsp05_08040 [Actinokineospora sp. NBRC 105648]|nr:hypothetical protein Acsp05_08040 [Actinokineospora sp. NBRC 105648]